MSVEVRIPTVLRSRVGGRSVVAAEGSTVREVLHSVAAAHPGFGALALEVDGTPKRFLSLFVEDEDVRFLQGLDTPVPDGSTLAIWPAGGGG